MRIENYLNTTEEEVRNRTHNIWIGISFGNKYFTNERVKKYIELALNYTKENVLVVVADYIHAINLEVLDNRTSTAALNKALRLGEEKYKELEKIIDELLIEQKARVKLVRWKDSVNQLSYKKNLAIIKEEFQNNKEFHDYILEIVKNGRSDRISRLDKLSKEKMDRLADYILNELPHFVDGVQTYNEKVYTLLLYPGLSGLDTLFVGLQNKTMFPALVEKLHITHKIGILEAYTE